MSPISAKKIKMQDIRHEHHTRFSVSNYNVPFYSKSVNHFCISLSMYGLWYWVSTGNEFTNYKWLCGNRPWSTLPLIADPEVMDAASVFSEQQNYKEWNNQNILNLKLVTEHIFILFKYPHVQCSRPSYLTLLRIENTMQK